MEEGKEDVVWWVQKHIFLDNGHRARLITMDWYKQPLEQTHMFPLHYSFQKLFQPNHESFPMW
jgi:hypothetical protein